MGIRIITDSVSDIPKHIAKELNIEVLPLTVNFEDGSYKDGVEMSSKEFFGRLRSSKRLPSTSQVVPGEFIKSFEAAKKANEDAIVILMSSQLSGTYNSAQTAKEFINGNHIHIIDSKSVTFGQGLMVIEAARMANSGNSTEEIINRISYMKENMVYKFLIDDLEYLKKGGRLSSSQAMMGKLLNIKPILTMDDGVLVLNDKVRGKKKGVKWIINYLKSNNYDLSTKTVGLFHADDSKHLANLKEAILESFAVGEIIEAEVGAVVGTHAGPGCVAIAFFK